MTKEWTKEEVEYFVEECGGDTFALLGEFPFSNKAMKEIQEAYKDDDNVTDSELADLIFDLALHEAA